MTARCGRRNHFIEHCAKSAPADNLAEALAEGLQVPVVGPEGRDRDAHRFLEVRAHPVAEGVADGNGLGDFVAMDIDRSAVPVDLGLGEVEDAVLPGQFEA